MGLALVESHNPAFSGDTAECLRLTVELPLVDASAEPISGHPGGGRTTDGDSVEFKDISSSVLEGLRLWFGLEDAQVLTLCHPSKMLFVAQSGSFDPVTSNIGLQAMSFMLRYVESHKCGIASNRSYSDTAQVRYALLRPARFASPLGELVALEVL